MKVDEEITKHNVNFNFDSDRKTYKAKSLLNQK